MSVRREEDRYYRDFDVYCAKIAAEVDRCHRVRWRELVQACKTKKAVWEVIGRQQAYATFLKHHQHQTVEHLRDHIAGAAIEYSMVRAVLKGCGIERAPESFVQDKEPRVPESLLRIYSRYGVISLRSPRVEFDLQSARNCQAFANRTTG